MCVCALTAGCNALAPGARTPQPDVILARRTLVYDCPDSVRFAVRTEPGNIVISAPPELGSMQMTLEQRPSASGVWYAGGVDTTFREKGGIASIDIAGRHFSDCRLLPDKPTRADAK